MAVWLGGEVQSLHSALLHPLHCTGTASKGCSLFLGFVFTLISAQSLFAAGLVQEPLVTAPIAAVAHLCSLTISSCSSSGANVNAKDTVWLTPLHRAAASRNEVCADGRRNAFFLLFCLTLARIVALVGAGRG